MTEDLELAVVTGCVEVPFDEFLELSLEELSEGKAERERLRRSLRKAGIVPARNQRQLRSESLMI